MYVLLVYTKQAVAARIRIIYFFRYFMFLREALIYSIENASNFIGVASQADCYQPLTQRQVNQRYPK
jgi:hypothetical protein